MDMRKRTFVPSQMTPTTDLELNQRSLFPELSHMCQGNLSHMSVHSMIAASRNSEAQHLPDHGNGAMRYGMSQYNGSRIYCAQDIRVATIDNPCFSYLTSPSGTEQFPFSTNYGLIGMSTDAYARNSHFVEEIGCPQKRRFTEGFPVNFQGLNSSASSQSSNASFNSRYCYNSRHLTRGDHMVRHLQPAGDALLLDQHINSNFEDRGAWTWNQASAGDNVFRGSSESLNLGFHRYPEISGIGCSTSYQHPPSTMIQHFSHQYPLPQPHLQGGRGQNISFHPQVAAAAQRIPLSSPYGIMHRQFLELEPRQTRDVPLTNRTAYDPSQGCVVPETMFQHCAVSQMRVLQENEVAVRAPDFNDIGEFADLYRDMRLDIDHMSYEELLALEEQIGNVRTGLSEETIMSQLKTMTLMPSARNENSEQSSFKNEETDSCAICLDVINDGKKIGVLDCKHYYHTDCLRQWLLIKNVCPVCKCEALTSPKKMSNDGVAM